MIPHINTITPLAPLTKSPLDLKFLKDDALQEIKKFLMHTGDIGMKNKSLIFDSYITPKINLMMEPSILKELGVTTFHILEKNTDIISDNSHFLYIIRPNIQMCEIVAEQMILNPKKYHYIGFLQNTNIECLKVFERHGLCGIIHISILHIDAIIMEDDILSMEEPLSFRQLNMGFDIHPLDNIMKALIHIQEGLGIIPFVQGVGNQGLLLAKNMIDIIHSKDYKLSPYFSRLKSTPSQIGRLIIIDRECDYITPLLNQYTYAGLVNEVYGISENCIIIPKSMAMDSKVETIDKKLTITKVINSSDIIFNILKDERIDMACSMIKEKIQLLCDARSDTKTKNINDIASMNESIRNLKIVQDQWPPHLLTIHLNLIDNIIKTLNNPSDNSFRDIEQEILLNVHTFLGIIGQNPIETFILDAIHEEKSPLKILRILCLYCQINDGIDIHFVNIIKSLLIRSYGIECVFILENLFKVGLLFPLSSRFTNTWTSIKNTFHLFPPSDDIATIYDGYIPLSFRLVEYALSIPLKQLLFQQRENAIFGGWMDKKVNKKLEKLKNIQSFHMIQNIGQEHTPNISSIVLVCFIGGITHGEISALRTLTKKNKGKHILILTTHIISGNEFIKTLK